MKRSICSICHCWPWCVAAIICVGCSSQDFAQVGGTVRYADGSPIVGGVRVIRFEPIRESEDDHRKPAFSHIDDSGAFSLMTRTPKDGVVTGKYAATFTVLTSQQESRSLIPAKYTVPRTSPFHVVVEGDKADWLFELDKR
jgi:hypothetical protein